MDIIPHIPRPSDRDREADIEILKKAMFRDLYTGELSQHTLEGGDLLYGYVTGALGEKVRVSWVDIATWKGWSVTSRRRSEWPDALEDSQHRAGRGGPRGPAA